MGGRLAGQSFNFNGSWLWVGAGLFAQANYNGLHRTIFQEGVRSRELGGWHKANMLRFANLVQLRCHARCLHVWSLAIRRWLA